MYLGSKEVSCIFKTCCIISFIFHKCWLFLNFIFFCSYNTFFINHALKCKFQPSLLKVCVMKVCGGVEAWLKLDSMARR